MKFSFADNAQSVQTLSEPLTACKKLNGAVALERHGNGMEQAGKQVEMAKPLAAASAPRSEDTQPEGGDEQQSGMHLPDIDPTPLGAVVTKSGDCTIHCMTIIGQIEGHYILGGGQKSTKYEHLIPMLVAVEEDEKIDGLLIVLNTVGGDVEAGLALAEMIASMKKPTVSLVLGGGHSIGVPLAVSADVSYIVPSATMTLHPVRMNGLVIGVPQTFSYFTRMQERIFTFISSHSKATEDTIRMLTMNTAMIATDVGTIIDGNEAVSYGIIDHIGGLSDALKTLRSLAAKDKKKNAEATEEK